MAQRKVNKSNFSFNPVGSITRNASITSATSITISPTASGIFLQADTGDVRFTFDGTTPTSTLGLILKNGASATRLDLQPGTVVKVISASGAINYQQFKAEINEYGIW